MRIVFQQRRLSGGDVQGRLQRRAADAGQGGEVAGDDANADLPANRHSPGAAGGLSPHDQSNGMVGPDEFSGDARGLPGARRGNAVPGLQDLPDIRVLPGNGGDLLRHRETHSPRLAVVELALVQVLKGL